LTRFEYVFFPQFPTTGNVQRNDRLWRTVGRFGLPRFAWAFDLSLAARVRVH
jgi:hypothetical protein